jgi:nitrous oxide reductase accessory protein NosL
MRCKKKIWSAVLLVVFLAIGIHALAQQDVDKQGSCKYCGMDRKMFAHSRMLIVYEDGSELGTCSLHCVAVDLALNIDKMPKSIQVADYNTKNLIDAEKAVWVIGGEKPGVMSKRAKWAFEKKAEAEAFIQANKGSLADFEGAIKAAYEDMYADTKMIREKRKAKRMKQGS